MPHPTIPIELLVTKLRAFIDNNRDKGYLYYAIKVVVSDYGGSVDNFLQQHGITQNNPLDQDASILANLVGFPTDCLIKETRVWSTYHLSYVTKKQPSEHISYFLIAAAASIVLFHQEASSCNSSSEPRTTVRDHDSRSPNRGNESRAKTPSSINKPPPVVVAPILRKLNLAMVLHGKDLDGIETASTLTLDHVEALLFNASYFLCILEQNMREIEQQLSLAEITDRKSEPQVLLIVHFDSALEEGKIFNNRLELMPVLRAVTKYKVIALAKLTKVSGLTSLGFVRS